MPKLIIGFVGPLSSGKGTCCKYLTEHYSAKTYRFSSILRDILKRLHLPHTRENLQNVSLGIRQTLGDDVLAKAIADDVSADAGELVTIDGIRRLPDIKYIRSLDNFHLVAVTADEQVRYERLTQRHENVDDERKTFADFVKDGKQEAEQQIAEIVNRAEFTVDNNGTLDELYDQLNTIVSKLRTP
ncbi:MAG: AAA family ATPase [Patescibacteria group bacterium]|nr:AAA family ATPase [Patescibacteria group bacterium]